MTSETVFDALTDVRTDYVKEAASPLKRQTHSIRYALWAAAACAALTAFAIAGLPQALKPNCDNPPHIDNTNSPQLSQTPEENETPPQKEAIDETLQKLPVPDLPAYDGLGEDGCYARSADELTGTSPWDETMLFGTLPVFKNPITYAGSGVCLTDDQEMESRLSAQILEIAQRIGIDQPVLTPHWEDCNEENKDRFLEAVTGESDGVTIVAESIGTVSVNFSPALSLPDSLDFDWLHADYGWTSGANPEDLGAIGAYIADEYADLLGMTAPTAAVGCTGYSFHTDPAKPDCRKDYSLRLYDGSGDILAQLISHDFDSVYVYCDSEGKLSNIRSYPRDHSEKVGDYPILTPAEAREALCAGNYLPQGTYEMSDAKSIAKIELFYRCTPLDEYFLPYYRFLVELPDMAKGGYSADCEQFDLKYYHAYYVPAVRPEYFTDVALWDGLIN